MQQRVLASWWFNKDFDNVRPIVAEIRYSEEMEIEYIV
jgi:hypothetical protein